MSVSIYSNTGSLSVGSQVYLKKDLTTPAFDGIYSDSVNAYTVSGGVVSSIAACSVPTTTTTSTTSTTTINTIRKTVHFSNILTPKAGLATSNVSPFIGSNLSFSDLIIDDTTLEQWNIKSNSNQLQRFGERWGLYFNSSANISPDYTFTDGSGTSIIRSVKEMYQFVKKYVNNTDLITRNPIVKIHRVQVDVGVGTPLETYFAVTLDFDYLSTDIIGRPTYNARQYNIQTTPYTIVKPSTSGYSSLLGNQNYPGTYSVITESAQWVQGNTIPGSTAIIKELNIPIPSSW